MVLYLIGYKLKGSEPFKFDYPILEKMEVLKSITNILNKTPGLKGREIAKKLGLDKKTVNSFLSKNHDGLYQDENWNWHPIEKADNSEHHRLVLKSEPWVTATSFEFDLQNTGCFFQSNAENFIIEFPKNCKVLLVAGARIIAIANQLADLNKNITLDFSDCPKTKYYLNRLGFFDHLDNRVSVLPKRPLHSRAKEYKGNSKNLVEIAKIDLTDFDETIPEQLTAAFVHHASEDYYMAAFTIFSELIGNVQEHSETKLSGFAALQKYKGLRPHIQTVVSDNGTGISATLKENLKSHYPDIYKQYDLNDIDTDIFLVKEALTKGGLSKLGPSPDLGRGLGLKRSQDYAIRFNAMIIVRQKTFELILEYENGSLVKIIPHINLPTIHGTQICFDFFLD